MSSPSWTTVAAPVNLVGGYGRGKMESSEVRGAPGTSEPGHQPGNFRCPQSGSIQRPVTSGPDEATGERRRVMYGSVCQRLSTRGWPPQRSSHHNAAIGTNAVN